MSLSAYRCSSLHTGAKSTAAEKAKPCDLRGQEENKRHKIYANHIYTNTPNLTQHYEVFARYQQQPATSRTTLTNWALLLLPAALQVCETLLLSLRSAPLPFSALPLSITSAQPYIPRSFSASILQYDAQAFAK